MGTLVSGKLTALFDSSLTSGGYPGLTSKEAECFQPHSLRSMGCQETFFLHEMTVLDFPDNAESP